MKEIMEVCAEKFRVYEKIMEVCAEKFRRTFGETREIFTIF